MTWPIVSYIIHVGVAHAKWLVAPEEEKKERKRDAKSNGTTSGKKGRGRRRPVFSGRYNPSIVIDTMNGRGSIPREVWLHKRRTAITV